VTGDLLTRPAGEPVLRTLLARLPSCYVVLGNHDYGDATDPFALPSSLDELEPATLLRDESRTVELRGRRVQVAGLDARTARRGGPPPVPDATADLRVLLCHYPRVIERVTPGDWHLVLAGHMHAGQIVVPWVTGKLHLAHLGAVYTDGVYLRPGGVLHVSPGLGTTFVPFRFLARPEATELVLQSA
jgi:predicted MPP superfamily phosphohydrolase